MENIRTSENLMMYSRDSLASVDGIYKKDEIVEEYTVAVDVSKAAVVQRTMKWAGLKPVSFVALHPICEIIICKWVSCPSGCFIFRRICIILCRFTNNCLSLLLAFKEFLVGAVYK